MWAQSTGHPRIAQPAGPHNCAHPADPTPRCNPWNRRRPSAGAGGLRSCGARSALESEPAVAGLDHQSGACERHECKDDSDGLSLEDGLHGYQSHRIPAPTVRAIDARSMSAQVKRARFAFTIRFPFQRVGSLLDRRPGGLDEIPGFASPPRGGFALDGRPSGRTGCPFECNLRVNPGTGP